MDNHQKPSSNEPIPVQLLTPYAQYPAENEINLADLWRVLVNGKKTIMITAATCLLLAVFYLMVTNKVYKTTALTLPPSNADIQPLNIPSVSTTTPEAVYSSFLTNIGSVNTQRTAFEKIIHTLPELSSLNSEEKENVFNGLATSIQLPVPDKNTQSANFILATPISIESSQTKLSHAFLNATISEANSTTIAQHIGSLKKLIQARLDAIPSELDALRHHEKNTRAQQITQLEEKIVTQKKELEQRITAVRAKLKQENAIKIAQLEEQDQLQRAILTEKINTLKEQTKTQRLAKISRLEETNQLEIATIENTIAVLRKNEKDKRLDTIERLKEALNIAKALGIQDPVPAISLSSSTSSMLQAEIKASNNEPPLYLRGEKALRAEITELESRTSDDPFIVELRPLLDMLAQLETSAEIATLKNRTDDTPYIKDLPALLAQLARLETNEEIEMLKARNEANNFTSPELVSLHKELALLEDSPALNALKIRKDDLAFSKEALALQKEQKLLESIRIDAQTIKTAIVDRQAYTEKQPLKPKKELVLALALIAGLMLGVFVAFFAHFVASVREET